MKHFGWFIVLIGSLGFSQAARYDSVALNPRGAPIPNATITLCTGTATGTPCSPTALGYTDITTSVSCASGFPVVQQIGGGCTSTTDGNGNFGFWLVPGTYKYSISGPSVATPQTYTITVPIGSNSAGLAVLANGIQTSSINNTLYLGSALYPCTTAGIVAANTVLTTGTGSGGNINALGCHGTITATAGFTLGGSGVNPVHLWLDTSTWNMGSFQITLNRNSGIFCRPLENCIISWTGDVDGIVTPTGTTGGYVTIDGLQLQNQGLATAGNAVVHYIDCPRCQVLNTLIAFDSTVASAGLRIETKTGNLGFGTWGGEYRNVWVQRFNSANPRATSGQIDVDLVGLSGQTNGDVSKNSFYNMHLEGATVDFQIFCGSSNLVWGGDMQNGAPEINIKGTVACNSTSNIINTNLNGASVAGSQGFTIDANSTGNTILGNDSQNLVADTDAGTANAKSLFTGSSGGTVDLSGGGSGFLISMNTLRLKLTTGANQFTCVNGAIYVVADNTSGRLFMCEPDIHGATPGLVEDSIDPITPRVAGTQSLGTTLLPYPTACLGTAATNNLCITPAATGGARTVSIPDPGANANLTLTPGNTLQKPETGSADANVLTVTPPAASGTYRVCVAISVASATAGVISWTLSWTDSSSNVQANIAQPLFQFGTAAPNTTFTTSAAGNYEGCSMIGINNAGANIVVKWVGGGTTAGNITATVERLN